MGVAPRETFDENTLFKVLDSLITAGLTYEAARETINDMQSKGILFRERGPEVNAPIHSHPTYRGGVGDHGSQRDGQSSFAEQRDG